MGCTIKNRSIRQGFIDQRVNKPPGPSRGYEGREAHVWRDQLVVLLRKDVANLAFESPATILIDPRQQLVVQSLHGKRRTRDLGVPLVLGALFERGDLPGVSAGGLGAHLACGREDEDALEGGCGEEIVEHEENGGLDGSPVSVYQAL